MKITKEQVTLLGLAVGVVHNTPEEELIKELTASNTTAEIIKKLTEIAFDINLHAYVLQRMLEKHELKGEQFENLFRETQKEVEDELDMMLEDQLAEMLPLWKHFWSQDGIH